VSRSTLRQVLVALAQAGIVRRAPGRAGGTFVTHAKVERDLSMVAGVPEYLQRQGFQAGTRVLSTGMVAADEATASGLEIEVGAVDSTSSASDSPTAADLAGTRAAAGRAIPGLLEMSLGGSLYGLLAEHFDVTPDDVVERIEVVGATPDEAALLV